MEYHYNLSEIKDILDLEEDLEKVLKDNTRDSCRLDESIKKIRRQIQMVENKESALKKIKLEYIEILGRLESINNRL